MALRDTIHRLKWGTPYRHEYLCVAEDQLRPLLVVRDRHGRDWTNQHLFLGYRPLVFGFWEDGLAEEFKLEWYPSDSAKPIAGIALRKAMELPVGEGVLSLYEGTDAFQHFLPLHQQWQHRLRHRLATRKDEARLGPKAHDMARVAYALPRTISVASVAKHGQANIFPTDLNGPFANGHYAVSLRKAGMAHRQVLEAGTLLLAQMDARQAGSIYPLGRNHMIPWRDIHAIPEAKGEIEGWPVPEGVLRYRVLERTGGTDIGIHHIHLCRVLKDMAVADGDTLAHIHRDYATWRWRMGLHTEIMDR